MLLRSDGAVPRVALLLLLAVTVGAQAVPTVTAPTPTPSSALDSVGANALSTVLHLLPQGLKLQGLRMNEYQRTAAPPGVPVAGPFGVVYTAPPRKDSLVVQVLFEWAVNDVLEGTVPDNPALGSVYVRWSGRDYRAFSEMYARFRDAFRSAPVPPACADLKTDMTGPTFTRRSREAAWEAGGWYASLFIRAATDSSGSYYSVMYRAARNSIHRLTPVEPVVTSWKCLPRAEEVRNAGLH